MTEDSLIKQIEDAEQKLECPKDADDIYIPKCNAILNDPKYFMPWFCTLDAGHKGKHKAEGMKGQVFKVWK